MNTQPEQVAIEIQSVIGEAINDLEFGALVDRVVAHRLLSEADLLDAGTDG